MRGLAVQPDGQIVVVGAFSEVNGRALAGVARLHPNGTVEAVETFDVGLGANGRVNCVALQDDGKLVIGGVFTEVAGVGRAGLARLNGDGSLDLGFAPVVDGEVDAVVVDEEGRIVVAGDFAGIDGQARGRIARLLADGTVESTDTFDVGVGADGRVRSVALQADGSLVIGGDFAQVGGQLRGRVARLFDNGTVESTITFDSGVGADGVVNGVAIAADGGILLGGGFGSFGGVAGGSFARVHNAVGEAELLVVDAGEVRWNRDGTAPQLSGVGFEWSADGQAPWSEIGGVERWEDGWRARGLSLPNVGVVRARGRASGGEGGGSSGMSEVVGGYVNAPAVVTVGASDVTANGAKVYAAVDPNGEAEVYFEFGFDEAFGQRSEGQVLSGVGVFDVQSLLTGLVGNSTYRYRAVAETSGGVYVGDTLTLVTAPEPPLVTTGNPTEVSGVGATFVGAVNPRGRPVEVFFEWGATTLYGNTTEVQMVEAGTAAVDVFAPVSGLTPDQVYHYRIVATGSGGTAIGSDVSFEADAGGEAVALPVVVTGDAVDRQTGGATLYATVNPQGGFTSAYFEYGETDAYGSVTPVLGAGNGNSEASLFSVVKGLAPGRDYHYRVVAANSLGTSMGEDVMFSTRFLPPAVTTGGAESVSTTSIRVAGVVRANDAATQVSFEYGTDGVSFPAAVAGVPATVTGDVEVSVEAELINLSQGVTYHYRIRGENSGGVSFGGAGTFTMDILSGLAQVFPGAPPEAAGEVTVEIEPAGIGAGWRFLGEGEWRAPGETVSGLVTGEREIEYRPVPGFLQPLRDVAAVVSGGDPLLIERRYYESEEDGSGGVSVVLLPEAISDPGVAEPERAQWRLAGEDDTMWRDSGVVLEGLVPGSYLIECKEIAGRDEPKPSSVLVADGETGLVTLTYSLESVRSGAGPEVLDFATVSAGTAWPYGWVGQLRSNAGLATGTVVKPRVVLTAGHVVFDDGTLSPAVGLEWMHQRDRGAFEPAPQEPRGYYLFTGYAAQREAEDTPGGVLAAVAEPGCGDAVFPGGCGSWRLQRLPGERPA